MATCGEYELERAIGWGRRATFFIARTNGGGTSVVIRRARTGERAFSQAFLRAAAEQQAAVGAGCRRLAPILAFECDETGFAFYATERYETSLAEFLEAGCKADSALLREIVTSVLGALSELHEKSRRAHGNLTPGNILLDPHGRFFLTDLAHSAKDATTADDLFALGTLIYQLVRCTARIGMLNPPLDYSPEWTESLGDDAEGWLVFTNRLLAKSRNASPDAIKSALGDLRSLAGLAAKAAKMPQESGSVAVQGAVRRPPPKKRSPLPKVIAIILLLAGGGGGYVWWKKKEDEKKAEIARKQADDDRRKREEMLPPAIKNLHAELKQLPPEIAADKTLKSLLGRIGKSLDGSGSRSDVASLLGNWELPDKMKTQAATWRNVPREWTHLAGDLDAAAQIDAEGETSIVGQLQRAIAARSAADELDRQWSEIVFVLKDLVAAKNRLLPDFSPWAANEIRGARDFADASARASAALKTLGEVREFQQKKWALVVQQRFEKEAGEVLQTPSDDLMPGWPGKWKREAERLVGPTDEKRAEWDKVLANAEARIPKRPAKEQPAWQQKLAAARSASADALETDVSAIEKMLAEFKGLRLPIEEAHEQYAAFLTKWKDDAANANSVKDAQAVLKKFQTETGKLLTAYQTQIGNENLAKQMADALATPDKISLNFSQPGWELVSSDPGAAIYKFRGSVEVPFLALGKTGFAMSAIETPLNLAKLSGAGGSPPGTGPKIRGADFSPEASDQWLWKGPIDFIRGAGLATYFAPGVSPGDVGSDTCPVTWLGFQEAKQMAEKLGGHLPTAEQWSSATNRAGPMRRLRASAWTAQTNQVLQWNTTLQVPTRAFLPDAGSFSKQPGLSANIAYLSDTTAAAGASDDRTLWLKSVYPPNGWKPTDGFYHLIGNAAEWVDSNGAAAVMGGSVVSPPTLPTNTALPIRTGSGAFDVTFRLVVKLGPGGEGIGIEEFKKAAAGIGLPPAPAVQ
jgi:serine/threonine protein kinase